MENLKLFIVDNQEDDLARLDQIIDDNELTDEQINLLDSLEIDENCYIGIIEIKRVK